MLFSLISALGLVSCEDNEDPVDPGFDRSAMLESVANNLIIPNFESLQASVTNLSNAASTFTQTTNEENLAAMRTAWVQAAKDHQHCSAFGFGPGELLLGPYTSVLGVFPISEEKVERNILATDFDLANSFDRDVRGFYAVATFKDGTRQVDFRRGGRIFKSDQLFRICKISVPVKIDPDRICLRIDGSGPRGVEGDGHGSSCRHIRSKLGVIRIAIGAASGRVIDRACSDPTDVFKRTIIAAG